VPYRIKLAEPDIGFEEVESVTRALRTGQVSGNTEIVQEFEQAFANYVGKEYAVAVSNGTAALHLALRLLDVKPTSAVIIPAFSGIYIPNAVTYCGGRLLLVDCERKSWGMDPKCLTAKLESGDEASRVKAVVVMHAYGNPCQVDQVSEICASYNLPLIEDCAEAHGATLDGRKVGSFGTIGCFSFYANKVITTGEGGALVMDNRSLYRRALSLRTHAFGDGAQKFVHSELGYNYRLSGLLAALGIAQLGKIERYIELRRRLAHLYQMKLATHENLEIQQEPPRSRAVYWYYSILNEKRNLLMDYLDMHSIESRPFFQAVNLQPLYAIAFQGKGESYLVAEHVAAQGLNLPLGNTTTEEQVTEVCARIKEFIKLQGHDHKNKESRDLH
jgi:perosamine synthetase